MKGTRLIANCVASRASAILRLACDKSTRRANHFGLSEIDVKSVPKKYFGFPELQIKLYVSPSRPIKRGVAQRHQRGAGMRWTRMALLTRALEADGEVVRFRHLGAGVKFALSSAGDGGKKADRRGDHV